MLIKRTHQRSGVITRGPRDAWTFVGIDESALTRRTRRQVVICAATRRITVRTLAGSGRRTDFRCPRAARATRAQPTFGARVIAGSAVSYGRPVAMAGRAHVIYGALVAVIASNAVRLRNSSNAVARVAVV